MTKRGGKTLKRQVGHRPELKTLFVFCEGENSEPDYIRALMRVPGITDRAFVRIEIDPEHGVPLTLVKNAATRLLDKEVDECWCIFDVEWPQHHPNLAEALRLAQDNGVRLAISNPCFELWLILHYRDQTAFITTDETISMSKQLDGRTGKHINGAVYMGCRYEAVRRAKQLAVRHERNGSVFPDNNPASGMDEFLQAFGADVPPAVIP